MAEAWSNREIELIVKEYLQMLKAELAGIPYNKTEHRRRLRPLLSDRSDGSIERKHQNISAILREVGVPYIDGYKPLGNYQRNVLPEVVQELIVVNGGLLAALHESADAAADVPTVEDILHILESPPERLNRGQTESVYERAPDRILAKFDYVEREARNRELGRAGELFVMNYERARLVHEGKGGLAERIEHVSLTHGDGSGFDIKSFETDGTDRFIEAKTTKYARETPFYVSRNEVEVSQRIEDRYWLYRLFKFGSSPRLFTVSGAIADRFVLSPTTFRAAGIA